MSRWGTPSQGHTRHRPTPPPIKTIEKSHPLHVQVQHRLLFLEQARVEVLGERGEMCVVAEAEAAAEEEEVEEGEARTRTEEAGVGCRTAALVLSMEHSLVGGVPDAQSLPPSKAVEKLDLAAIKKVKQHRQQVALLEEHAEAMRLQGTTNDLTGLGAQLLDTRAWPDYTKSRVKCFMDMARASYETSGCWDGEYWGKFAQGGIEIGSSQHNLRVVGRLTQMLGVKQLELCFRGSVFAGREGGHNLDNWFCGNLAFVAETLDRCILDGNEQPQVHHGFQLFYLALRDDVLRQVERSLGSLAGAGHDIVVVGHSLGAALATLCALDLANKGYAPTLITWASPRVGDKAFSRLFAEMIPAGNVARFTCGGDYVPSMPLASMGFCHVSDETRLDGLVTTWSDGGGAHKLDMHAQHLENCFRNPLHLVEAIEGAYQVTKAYLPFAKMAAIGIRPGLVAGWFGGRVAGWVARAGWQGGSNPEPNPDPPPPPIQRNPCIKIRRSGIRTL